MCNFKIFWVFVLMVFLFQEVFGSEELKLNIGFRESIKSEILDEYRNIIIRLPDRYDESSDSYPVIYLLDGDVNLMLMAITVINRLTHYEAILKDMIVVAIENVDRSRDMWPVNTRYYSGAVGAKDFLDFIEKELIPHIDSNYRTANNKTLYGESLSGIFTIYTFLDRPELFDSYIVSSAGFPDCEDYFKKFSQESFDHKEYNNQAIFVTNGLNDLRDPDEAMHEQIAGFFDLVDRSLNNKVRHKYLTYDNEGHVPFQSLYHGLKFIHEGGSE